MTDALHYRFPPARTYPLNRCLFALKSDAAFRARFLEDPTGAMSELNLGADDQAAVLARDRDTLTARGASLPDLHGRAPPANGRLRGRLRVLLTSRRAGLMVA
jgi:hypothetical protein